MKKVKYKVVSPDRQIWYGTYKTKKEAEDRQKEYPKDETTIIEVS